MSEKVAPSHIIGANTTWQKYVNNNFFFNFVYWCGSVCASLYFEPVDYGDRVTKSIKYLKWLFFQLNVNAVKSGGKSKLDEVPVRRSSKLHWLPTVFTLWLWRKRLTNLSCWVTTNTSFRSKEPRTKFWCCIWINFLDVISKAQPSSPVNTTHKTHKKQSITQIYSCL